MLKSAHVYAIIAGIEESDETTGVNATMELDSHANVVLLGRDCFVFDGIQGKTCRVIPYDPGLGTGRDIPIVDGAVAYDCDYTHQTYIMVVRNALYVPTLDHSLIPPFILREAGIIVKDTAKIHVKDPSVEDHSIYIPDLELRIPLQLHGIFSYFHVRKPLSDEIVHCPKAIITPDGETWDPYSSHYAENEASMLDWEGNMMDERYHKKLKKEEDYIDISSVQVQHIDHHIDSIMASFHTPLPTEISHHSAAQQDTVDFAEVLLQQAEISHLSMATGSMGTSLESYDDLFVSDTFHTYSDIGTKPGFISSAIADKPGSLSADFLSKIW